MANISYTWWNLLPLKFDPIIADIGSFKISFYGLSYFLAFITCYIFAYYIIKKEKLAIEIKQLEKLFIWLFIGLMVGSRIGYVVFYNLDYFISHPHQMFFPFKYKNGIRFIQISGMSYHGGLLGSTIAASIYVYKEKINYWLINSIVFTVAPIGYTWGRLGNFVNHELYGRVTTSWIGMIFPTGGNQLRHPSQLYEAMFEGIILFLILINLRKIRCLQTHLMSFYIMGYNLFRFFIEYFREPDEHIGLTKFLQLSRGQIICLMFFGVGLGIMFGRIYLEKRSGPISLKMIGKSH